MNIYVNNRKRTRCTDPVVVQDGNRAWWTDNAMSYDWPQEIRAVELSRAWFDEIDARFIHASRLFAHGARVFDRVIPFDRLANRRVLEIGCGMGLHTELMVRAGARVTALDISPRSVHATRARLAQNALKAEVLLADAEHLELAAGPFDFVWSWGVIHHSARTARIVRNIADVLAEDGECRLMVYNREGAAAYARLLADHLIRGRVFRHTFDETLWSNSDGYTARFYVPEQFADLLRAFFDVVSCSVLGLESDAVPLPRCIRRYVLRAIGDKQARALQAKWGSFVFACASKAGLDSKELIGADSQ